MRWKQTGSELDIRKQAKPFMKLAGLRSDAAAVSLGISIVRGWVSDGLGPQAPADVGRQAAEMGLAPEIDETASVSVADSMLACLPPRCRVRVEALRELSPEVADLVSLQMAQAASRAPGVLAFLADHTPSWLLDADSLAWEALAGFLDAHGLPGSWAMRCRAIERNSPRSTLYTVREAAVAALNEDDVERARELLAEVPEQHPLFSTAWALINDDVDAVVTSVRASALHESQDPDEALFGITTLDWAYQRRSEIELAIAVLKDAIERFPDRASLYLLQAERTLGLAKRRATEGTETHALHESAAALAIEARDRFREWSGPSAEAVATAAESLLLLDQPQRVCDVAMVKPEGEATPEEAEDASVVRCLAHALLALGRHEEIDNLSLELVDGSEGALLLAMQARSRGDADAEALMRRAVERADDDRTRLMALNGLALFGEVDEAALAQSSPTEAVTALVRAVAAYHKDDYRTAVSLLSPYGLESPMHAEFLARAQHQSGATDDAIDTLGRAAETRGAVSVYGTLVELLMEQNRLVEAETVAQRALASALSRSVEYRLRHSLAEIARRLRDWPSMETYGRALMAQFPDAPLAPWAVIQALANQAKSRSAWQFIIEHKVRPIDEPTALLAIGVYWEVDASEEDVERLLEIAGTYEDSEVITGAALAALMVRGDRVELTDAQSSLFAGMVNDYFARFPDSRVLWSYSIAEPEEALEIIETLTEPPSVEIAELANRVRNGQLPYGVLRAIRALPYAELLLSMSAGRLTAISTNDEQREKERSIARAAMSGTVSADTSVVTFEMHTGLALDSLAEVFTRVLVADELIADARAAVSSVSRPIVGVAGRDPALGRASVSEISEQQREQMRESAQRLLDRLHGWHSVPSGRISPPVGTQEDHFRPWDASLRVALDKKCALWCDDIALRGLAEAEGIDTFGSYALYEVLAAEANTEGLPPLDELKAQLLRARIADVPLTWAELSEIVDGSDGSDFAMICFLECPLSWSNPLATFSWYCDRLRTMVAGGDEHLGPWLVQAASYGLGMFVEPSLRKTMMGGVLAAALGIVDSADMSPYLLEAGRYACRQVDPSGELDVLPEATADLLRAITTELTSSEAAQQVTQLFAQAEQADRNTVAAVILGAHE